MKTVLLTGFEPFGGHLKNPTQAIANSMHGMTVGSATVIGMTLPVVFGEDTPRMFDAIARFQPELVLSMGLSAGSECAHIEMFAMNHRNGDGNSLLPILTHGPAAYFATIDVDRIARAMANAGMPAQRHGYAGSFLCNHIYYQTLHHVATKSLATRVGFIHLPHASDDVSDQTPSLPLAVMREGIRRAIEEALS